MSPLLRCLRVLSILECVSVVGLLANMATVHDTTVAATVGPVHGALYLGVVMIALFGRGLATRTRVYAVLPLLSGPLTLVQVRREVASR
jgi:formate/nitrite transporter FocA (FNT family)